MANTETNVELMALMLDAERRAACGRWGKVRRIIMSAERLASLRANTPRSELPLPWASVTIESSPVCDESFAVLVSGSGDLLGVFSFVSGVTRWFDEAVSLSPRNVRFQFTPLSDFDFRPLPYRLLLRRRLR